MEIKMLLKSKRDIKNLIKQKKYSEALEYVLKVLQQFPAHTPLLLLKADLMQMQELGPLSNLTNRDYMSEIKKTLELAIKLDENSTEALLELGHYFFVFKNDNKTAKHFFSKTIQKAKKQYLNAYLALIKVFIDSSDYKNAKLFLKKTKKTFGSIPEIKDLEDNIWQAPHILDK